MLILILLFELVSAAQAAVVTHPTRSIVKWKSSDHTSLDQVGVKTVQEVPALNMTIIESNEAQLKSLSRSPNVEYVERVTQLSGGVTPNDPQFYGQDYFYRTNTLDAWTITTGAAEVLVAVSDSGIDANHEDLKTRVWVNTREIAGNGVDDDGNGYIDDVSGWDFRNKDNLPDDDHGHGTHVSGVIGAEANNGIGIAGVNWNVKIMPLKYLGPDNKGWLDHAVLTILYAVNNGARLINASWGSTVDSPAIKDAINYAYTHGTLVICAAGNESDNTDTKPHYPAAHRIPGVLSIAASDYSAGELTSFSNYGARTIHLAAPGAQILSSLPGNSYDRWNGTSMATPQVVGAAALILSLMPTLPVNDLRNALLNAVNPESSLVGKLVTEGSHDTNKALLQLGQGFQVWPSHLLVAEKGKHTFTAFASVGAVAWSVSDTNVAQINAQTGELTALKKGKVTVIAHDASAAPQQADVEVIGELAPPPKKGCGGGSGGSMVLPLLAAFLIRGRRKV